MKFTTAIALAALLGNAAFSNAQDANGNLDICNPDEGTYDLNEFGCQKTCERPQTGIRNQVKIQCKVSLDGKNVDCFDPTVSAGGCREVDVKIQYKFMNTNKDLELELMYGDYPDKKSSWTAFDGDQVFEQDMNLRLAGNTAKKFEITKTIDTCTPYRVEIKSKMPVPDDVKDEIRDAQSGELLKVQQRIQRTCDDHPDYANTPCSPLDLTTDRCGVSGQILLCDSDCKAAWDAAQDENPAPAPGPNDPATDPPSPSGPKPDAPGPSPSGPKPDAPGPSPSGPKPDAPSPSTPKSKDGTKAPSTGKGTKEPSAGKGTKQPTIVKGKGTPEPVRRQMKNRKVARV